MQPTQSPYCPPGSYLKDFYNCIPCPPQTYSSHAKSKNCYPCGLGYYSHGNASSCTPFLEQSFAINFTSQVQEYVVPKNVSHLLVMLWGGGGGGGAVEYDAFDPDRIGFGGGAGGFTQCYLKVAAGKVLSIIAGGGGESGSIGQMSSGGYGGGGKGVVPLGDTTWSMGAGGGGSYSRLDGVDLVSAGGGGGGGAVCCGESASNGGGGGGGLNGVDGYAGSGASQTSGGKGYYLYSGKGNAGTRHNGGVTTVGKGKGTVNAGGPYGAGGGGGYWGGHRDHLQGGSLGLVAGEVDM